MRAQLLLVLSLTAVLVAGDFHPMSDKFIDEINKRAVNWKVSLPTIVDCLVITII